MNTLRLSLIVSMILAVTACSSGGKSGAETPSQTPPSSATPPTAQAAPTAPAETPAAVTPTETPNSVQPEPPPVVAKPYQGLLASSVNNVFTPISHDNVDRITIDGQSIILTPKDRARENGIGGSGNLTLKVDSFYSDSKLIVSGDHTKHVRYGLVGSQTGNQIFIIGEKTQTMPKGQATYEGRAIVWSPSKKGYDRGWTSEFSVDFDQKSLNGRLIDSHKERATPITAKLDGNSFKGELNGVYTEGFFFGNEAAELSGIFSDPGSDQIGAYGAARK